MRLREVDLPGDLQRVGAQDRHGDREQPHAHAAPAAHVHHVGDRAHGAEIGAVRDGAEDESEDESAPRRPVWPGCRSPPKLNESPRNGMLFYAGLVAGGIGRARARAKPSRRKRHASQCAHARPAAIGVVARHREREVHAQFVALRARSRPSTSSRSAPRCGSASPRRRAAWRGSRVVRRPRSTRAGNRGSPSSRPRWRR